MLQWRSLPTSHSLRNVFVILVNTLARNNPRMNARLLTPYPTIPWNYNYEHC